ncbi:hypothetical protein LJC74_00145 [Eubacteriales bacterium OttesenSCG-928-A19]|nr:hypothetical protein [Eubacteriales bacterium OttesenSCG-928-A19]
MHRRLIIILLCAAAILAVVIGVLLLQQNQAATPASEPDPTPLPTPQWTVAPQADVSEAEALVRQYLEAWSAQDTAGMEACLVEGNRGLAVYDDIPLVDHLQVERIAALPQAEAEERFEAAEIDASGGFAFVEADFTVYYNAEGKELYVRDKLSHEQYGFWLVQEVDEWRITLQGY